MKLYKGVKNCLCAHLVLLHNILELGEFFYSMFKFAVKDYFAVYVIAEFGCYRTGIDYQYIAHGWLPVDIIYNLHQS